MVKKSEQSTPNPRLSDERLQRGWSQQDVADGVGTTRVTISRWENGSTSPSPHFRQKLSELYGKTAEELGLVPENCEQPTVLPQSSNDQDNPPSTPASHTHNGMIHQSSLLNIPYRQDPFFTGRENIIGLVHTALHPPRGAAQSQPQALSGLGGIGKTQTAVEYAYRYQSDYQTVLWMQADTLETLVTDMVAIADRLNLAGHDTPDPLRIIHAFKDWLRDHQHWLLILDNVDDLTTVKDLLLPAYQGHILLTTQAQATGRLAQRIEIEEMLPPEGALFLLRRAGLLVSDAPLNAVSLTDFNRAKEISEAMSGLPLALDQAGAYIEETGCSLSDYLKLYRMRQATLLDRRGKLVLDHPESVVTTWFLCFEKVEQARPDAAELLRLCAFLHPDSISEEMITEGASELSSLLQSIVTDQLELDAAIEELRSYSLIRRNTANKSLTIHNLVQAVLRNAMDEDMKRQWVERTVRFVNMVYPSVSTDPIDMETMKRCQRYLPHAYVCAQLTQQYDLHFQEAAELLEHAGFYLRKFGQYKQAKILCEQALSIREQNPDANPLVMALSLNVLAGVYFYQGKYKQAEVLGKRALEIREQNLEPEHHQMAVSLGNLGVVYDELGRYQEAEHYLLAAVRICEEYLGKENLFADRLDNLGFNYHKKGKYQEAEDCLLRSLEIREQSLGMEHPEIGHNLNNLANVYRSQGKYDQAESHYKHALDICRSAWGSEHPEVADSFHGLAQVYYIQGKYHEVEAVFLSAIKIYEQSFGPEHPKLALVFNNLAKLYHSQKKYEEAEERFKQALDVDEAMLGDHPDTAQILNDLAVLYVDEKKYKQAKALLDRSLSICEKMLWLEHPTTVTVQRNYSDLLGKMDRVAEAALEGRLETM